MAKVAIMGYGTVGSGVYEIIRRNSEKLRSNTYGEPVELKYILDIRDFDDHPEKELFTKEFDEILNDEEVTVVAEVMGGLHPAYEFTKSLLQKGKNVTTSNKELVATYGSELLAIARENNVNYMFEASVGGGIPIIHPMHQCLVANNITRIAGILNGTTNYILYQMIENGKSFETALADAQANGFAEKNPAADVEGFDACRKIAILASLASGKEINYNNIETKGITEITLDDVVCAGEGNGVIKLIGYADMLENGKVYATVAPMFISKGSPLAAVNDVFNAIMVTGDCVDDVMFYGKGAGKLATASAVVADILDCVRHRNSNKNIIWTKTEEPVEAGRDDVSFAYFVRSNNSVSEVNAAVKVDRFITEDDKSAFITDKMTESEAEERLSKLDIITSLKVLG
ncbi:MAG: homoserine dehydrogenase [bacterium]|nr:homoserine dehydrogenase [bacterium]